jgi:hypothetical protein
MKIKNLLIATIAIIGLAINSIAQVPNYIPTNGLVGWWPFNGNANDGSGNNLNGTVSEASLTTDRFGNNNCAYNFSAPGQYIDFFSDGSWATNDHTISFWFNTAPNGNPQRILTKRTSCSGNSSETHNLDISFEENSNYVGGGWGGNPSTFGATFYFGSPIITYIPNAWNNLIYIRNGNNFYLYINGVLVGNQNGNCPSISCNLMMRAGDWSCNASGRNFIGKFDDLGLWNRALTQQEITNLFNANSVICANDLTISPASNQLQTGSTANFTAATSDPNPSYIWQSDFGQGFQTLDNHGNYSGVNTDSLSIANVQLPNHTQPIRVISTSGACIDTSNVATINITDTCIVTINDTITTLLSVTDTLVINTQISGLTPPNNSNTIKVFPNPTNDHITIDFGNFASMNGFTLTITNSLGQIVYTTPINQQSSYVDLTTWTGNGIYFVQIIDAQNNTIENRKIVLQ